MILPKDILEMIFSCLPVMHIARSRCVCRLWNEMLSSPCFLMSYGSSNLEKWVAVLDERGLNEQRILLFYNASLETWHRMSLSFLPPEFTDAVAAAGGLLCVTGEVDRKTVMCVCNPLTKTFRLLPQLNQELSVPMAVMIDEKNSFKVLVLSGDTVALYSATSDSWRIFDTGLPYRPRSPVVCDGVVFGLQNMGSPWQSSWRLVYAKLDELRCKEVWRTLNRQEWGEILDILRQPRLLESSRCLFLTGGLKRSASTNSCSTFIILKLDLATLEWSEAARMPMGFYTHFNPGADFKIFGGGDAVYFSSKAPGRLVACDFSEGDGVWRWVGDYPACKHGQADLCKGFPYHPRLDVSQ